MMPLCSEVRFKIPDVVLCRPAASKQVSHAARGFPSLGCFLGIAHMHAHHSGRRESAAHVFLGLGEHDVHLSGQHCYKAALPTLCQRMRAFPTFGTNMQQRATVALRLTLKHMVMIL